MLRSPEDRLRESWRLIGLDSQRLLRISSSSSLTIPDLSTTTPFTTQTSPGTNRSIFPLPPPLTSDLAALGIRPSDAQCISKAFLEAVVHLRLIYEDQFHKADQCCQAIIRAKGPLIPNFRIRLRSSHVSHYLAKVNLWSSKGVSITRQWLMQNSLNNRPSYTSLAHPPYQDEVVISSSNNGRPSPNAAFFKLEIDDAGQADLIKGMDPPDIAKLSTASAAEKDRHIQLLDSGSIDCWNAVELSSLFQQRTLSIKSDNEDVLHQRYSPCSFPKAYPCPASVCQDTSLKVLSRGLQRVMRSPSSQAASTDKVIESLTHLHISNSGSMSQSDIHDNSKPLIPAFLLTPPSSPRPSPPTSHLINRPVISNPLPTPPESPQSPTSEPFTSRPAYSKRYNRKIVSLPKRRQIPGDVCKDGQPALTEESASVTLDLSLPKTTTTPPRTPIDQERTLSVIIPPTSSSSPTAARKRKTAALPTRRVPSMMPNTVPTTSTPFAAQFAPLSVANVSSLSPSCTSVGPRSIISRTPSLVSLASIDSGSSSPSSDGLDTPPSTPPPFVTKFPSSISPFSSSSKSFTLKFDSAVSPGNLFQFSSAKQPKIFEAHLPSGAPLFEFSAGIKREEVSFSFAFGRR
uniref:B2 mating type protein n=1 Tax=Heterobasidion annosum TaxID=13563 RepID=S5R777_HETAN|nr:b2 mating type protein [Heterobasidion annosum]